MIFFNGWTVPPGFKSDGCTYAPDSWFGKDLKPACILHDFIRRYGLMPIPDADKLLRDYLIELGAPRWLAHYYWLGSKLMRPWFSETQQLPRQWKKYGGNT